MSAVTCSGLPASWLNGWLAAVGATVLDTRIRLHWTEDSTPAAVLSAADTDPVEAVVASWPDETLLADLPIAENWNGVGMLRRKVAVEEFAARARAARGHEFVWTLSSTMTDLYVDESGEVAHAPFDPAGPGTIKWLHHRLLKVHAQVVPSKRRIRESFEGHAIRVKDNGLGFDQTRLGSQSDASSTWVDPVVELLAFFGLSVLPVRGAGTDRRLGPVSMPREIQRGWRIHAGERLQRRFLWPAWCQPLDSAGIDALLDAWRPDKKDLWPLTGVHAAWQTVQFQPRGSADTTRAFGAVQL